MISGSICAPIIISLTESLLVIFILFVAVLVAPYLAPSLLIVILLYV
jgi:hypothetical protein